MKITDPSGIRNSSSVNRKRASNTGATGFAELLSGSGQTKEASVTADIAPLSELSGLLSLQEIPDEELKKKRAVERGKTMLDSLDRLHQALLTGTLPMGVLNDLRTTIADKREQVNDPQLLAIMDDIELRVAVELAKLEQHIGAA